MKKLSFLLMIVFISLNSTLAFAQNEKKVIDRIGSWRKDMACGMELGELIRTYNNNAVAILKECCKKHSSACLDSYSGPDNKTLLYTAIEVKAYKVADFLFNLSPNYTQNIDDYGKTIDIVKDNGYFIIKTTKKDPTSKTPLMLACYNGDLQGTKLLITYGASLLKKNYTQDNKTNKNAYDYAKSAKYKDAGFMEYVEKEYKKQKDLFGQTNKPLPKKINQEQYNKWRNERNRSRLINERFLAGKPYDENSEDLL